MIKVIMIRDTNKNKAGDVRELNEKRARAWVKDLKIAEFYKKARKEK